MEIIWGLELNDLITIFISLVAIFISIWDRFSNSKTNKKTNKKAEKALKLSQGVIEIELRNSITNARRRVDEFGLELRKFKLERPKADLSAHEKIFYSILEDYINQYDRACMLYLDKKIDRKAFKREYQTELNNIIKNENYNDRYFDKKKPRFKSVIKVHRKWMKKN
jgi:hypothetical protein